MSQPGPEAKKDCDYTRLLTITHRAADPTLHDAPGSKFVFRVTFHDGDVNAIQAESDIKQLLRFNAMREPFVLEADVRPLKMLSMVPRLPLLARYIRQLDDSFCVQAVIMLHDEPGMAKKMVAGLITSVIGAEKIKFQYL